MLALHEHPDQTDLLLHDPEIMPTAVEEVLRWASPATHLARVATADTELGGKQIRAGDRAALWFPSGNRDEAALPRPHAFDLKRKPNDHLAFSGGEHFCGGAHLARLELKLILQCCCPD